MTLPKKTIQSMVRVNHAGEYGALRIYQGQLKVLGDSTVAQDLQHMLTQEQAHLKAFEDQLKLHNTAPTLLQPLWDKGAFLLGLGTALLGKKAAMACTVAVEEVIDEHYRSQLVQLSQDPSQKPLETLIETCRQEELDHRSIALESGARESKAYVPLTFGIKIACKAAIFLSKKI
ncbi:MAG: demethoxyubiquinone hydroxylase family protein [Alphaproteobacteria bacterium]